MPLMLRQMIDEIEYFAGGTIDPRLDPLRIANDGGQYLHSMHEWSFQVRTPTSLDLMEDQPYIDLPRDFSKVISIDSTSTTSGIVLTSLEEVSINRENSSSGGFQYYAALAYPEQTNRREGPGPPRLEIFPTPSATTRDAFTIQYRAGWIYLVEMIDAANVPPPFEALLLDVVRAHADARVNNKSLGEALEPVERSRLLKRLKQSDGLAQARFATSRGGQLQGTEGHVGSWWPTGAVSIG